MPGPRVLCGLFSLYGIPIIRGRNLVPSDHYTDVIVSERLAQTLWQDADPIGRTYRFAQELYRIDDGGPRLELGDEQIHRVIGLAREIHFPADNTVIRHRLASTHPIVGVQAHGTGVICAAW